MLLVVTMLNIKVTVIRTNLYLLNLKQLGEVNLAPLLPCGFLKNVSSKEMVKPWFFVTFNIIIRHIFSENFSEIPQVV